MKIQKIKIIANKFIEADHSKTINCSHIRTGSLVLVEKQTNLTMAIKIVIKRLKEMPETEVLLYMDLLKIKSRNSHKIK